MSQTNNCLEQTNVSTYMNTGDPTAMTSCIAAVQHVLVAEQQLNCLAGQVHVQTCLGVYFQLELSTFQPAKTTKRRKNAVKYFEEIPILATAGRANNNHKDEGKKW